MTASRFFLRDAIVIFFSGLILFTWGLPNQEIIGFESRFYLFALEMWRHGLSWFPTTYQEPYPDYPVTSTWLIYLVANIFGTLNKWIAVLPSAIAASLTLSATYLIGATQDRKWGWFSAAFLLFTQAFLTESRTISLDMYVTAVTVWLFYFAYASQLQTKTPCWGRIGLLLIMGFAIRGPIGIVIPTGVLSVFYVLEKNWKSWFFLAMLSSFLLLACTSILLGIAYHVGGHTFMQSVFHMEIAGRMEVNRTPPVYFYLVESFGAYAITYPLAIFILIGSLPEIFKKETSPRIKLLRALAGWVLIIIVGLSIPADKKVRYILPIAPALALISGSLLLEVTHPFLRGLKNTFYLLCWMLPILSLGILSVLYQKQMELNYPFLVVCFVTLQALMLVVRKKETTFFLAVLTFFIANVFLVEKINLTTNQTKSFVQHIEELRNKQHAKLAFYREGQDGLAIKYLINSQDKEKPLFITDIDELPHLPIFIIVSQENVKAMAESERKLLYKIGMGKIGHDTVFVEYLNKL